MGKRTVRHDRVAWIVEFRHSSGWTVLEAFRTKKDAFENKTERAKRLGFSDFRYRVSKYIRAGKRKGAKP